MRLTDDHRRAIRLAVNAAGGQRAFARKCGIPHSAPGKYLSGRIDLIEDETWDRVRPVILEFMPRAASGRAEGQAVQLNEEERQLVACFRAMTAAGPGPELPEDQRALLAYYRACGAKARTRIVDNARQEFLKATGT